MVNGVIRYVITVTGLCWCISLHAQKQVADSIGALLAHEKQDSNKVTLLWNQAIAYNRFNPDSSILLAQKALVLARKIKFIAGESKSLGVLANAFEQIGNYPKSLEYFLLKLKLEEERDYPLNMASVLLSIGSVYVLQEEYENALNYYFKADSVMKNNVEGDPKFGFQLRYSIALNIGDLYNRINRLDSAYIFFQRSYDISKEQVNTDYTGMSMVGIGEVYLKQKEYEKSKKL